jgi:hypothetical protein
VTAPGATSIPLTTARLARGVFGVSVTRLSGVSHAVLGVLRTPFLYALEINTSLTLPRGPGSTAGYTGTSPNALQYVPAYAGHQLFISRSHKSHVALYIPHYPGCD